MGKNDSTDEESAADEQETWSSSTCRLCLKEGENTRHIFDAAKPLPSLIMECVSVEVTMDDGLPLLICQDCQHHLDSWYKFKQQCQTTDKILHGAAVTSDDEMSDNINEETQEIKPELEVTDSGSDELSKNNLQSAQDSSLTKINTKKSDNSLIVETLEMVPDQTVVDQNIPESNSEDAGAHKCTLCNKQFSTSVDYELHVELFHHQSESFSCGKCPKLFSTANMLLNHQCCHLPEGKGFSCPQCHKGFFSWPGLRNHFNIHMEKFKCSVCDKCETSSVSLKVHMRKHTKEQPFLCPMCPRTFAYESSLRYHIRRTHWR